MGVFGTILISVLIFGFLIFIHEFGHYFFARLFKVTINEFSIGMGPKLLWYDSKKTGIRYALAAIPFGGYVAMAGEDSESDDPNSFDKKPAWQRFIITVAGAAVNIIAGYLAMIVLTSLINLGSTVISEFPDTDYSVSSADSGLCVGDEIIRVDGKRVRLLDDLSYEIMRRGNKPIDVTVIRDGKEIVLHDVVFPTGTESGQTFGVLDFKVWGVKKTFGSVMKHSFSKMVLTVRMCWEALYDLITGRYTIAAVSGPVGISEAIGDAAQRGGLYLLNIITLISINLGVMNLMPIPALDGGRTVTLLVEMITKKRVPPRIENTINAVGLALLLGFSVFIMIKDVIQLIIG